MDDLIGRFQGASVECNMFKTPESSTLSIRLLMQQIRVQMQSIQAGNCENRLALEMRNFLDVVLPTCIIDPVLIDVLGEVIEYVDIVNIQDFGAAGIRADQCAGIIIRICIFLKYINCECTERKCQCP